MSVLGRLSITITASFIATLSNAQDPTLAGVEAIEWVDSSSAQLKALLSNTDVVSKLANQLGPPEDFREAVPEYVGEFRVVDLNDDGQLELVCTTDVSGRAFYTTLVVIFQQRGRLARAAVSTHGAKMLKLGSRIVYLNHDGRKEVIVPQLMEEYQGYRSVAELPDIYRFEHGALVKANLEFRAYYRETLIPQLKQKLNALQNEPKTDDQQHRVDVIRREIAAAESLYGA
jgi:hypothetical protein